jgi:hypothetical protein
MAKIPALMCPETTVPSPSAPIWTPADSCAAMPYQTVLAKTVPFAARRLGAPPPSGWPSRLTLKGPVWVVASVVSTVAVNAVRSTGSDARSASFSGGR